MYRVGNYMPGEPKHRKPAKPATLGAIERRREREVETKGEVVSLRARVWAVADVDTFRGEKGAGNAVWNEKGRKERRHGGSSWIANADENS